MKQRSGGSIIVLMLFLTVAFFWFGLLVANVGQAAALSQRAQTLADVSVLASTRMRVEALEAISKKWLEYGRLFGTASDNQTVQLPSAFWFTVEQKGAALKKSLAGYQGRATAVVKVVAEANGIGRERVEVADDGASRVGLSSQKAFIEDESGREKLLEGIWFKRGWTATDPDGTSRHRVRLEVPLLIGFAPDGGKVAWTIQREGVGRLLWDVSRRNPLVQAHGNGGYPRDWKEAIDGERLDPNRWATYRAALTEKKE